MRAAAVTLCAALALAGCGGGESSGGGDRAGGDPTPPDVPGSDAPRGNHFALEQVASGLDQPLGLVAAPGSGDLYVLEQPGRVRTLDGGRTLIDLRDAVQAGGEQGLLGLAFHPDYDTNGRLFVHYSNTDGDTRVDEYTARDGVADRSTRRELLAVDQPYPNHNGGELSFGPDGKLYLGLGDGGSAFDPEDRAQDLDERLGKLLRIDPDDSGADWEVAAYGLRNPWRFSWDRATGTLWIADVGQDEREEIDAIAELPETPPNFGWPAFEGTNDPDDRELKGPGKPLFPVAEYDHDEGCSVTGGYVYRGSENPALEGRYVYGDVCTGRVWTLKAGTASATDVKREDDNIEGLSSFGQDAGGELYAVALDGRVLRLVANGSGGLR